jgi:hypothetical protein
MSLACARHGMFDHPYSPTAAPTSGVGGVTFPRFAPGGLDVAPLYSVLPTIFQHINGSIKCVEEIIVCFDVCCTEHRAANRQEVIAAKCEHADLGAARPYPVWMKGRLNAALLALNCQLRSRHLCAPPHM